MSRDELLSKYRDDILRIAAEHGARKIRIFGSFARGDAVEESDLDLLVQMEEERSLFDFIAFWQDVEDLLGFKVDVVSEGGISPYLREKILSEAIPI